MPVIKCSNGKYRIGHGKCIYKTKKSAEKAYKGYLGSKYMTKKIDEKVELKAAGQKPKNDNMHSSDLKNMMRLAGIEKDIKSEDKKDVDFIGALSKGQISEDRFATFRMLEEEISKNINEDENSSTTLQYNIGDEVETPFGHGVIQDVCDDNKCLVKHINPKDEHGDVVEVNMDLIHRITEANLTGNIQYFKTDEIGADAINQSPLANEIKYSDDDDVMAISSDRMDEINDIINAAGGTLMIKEANDADPFGGSSFSPYNDEPSTNDMDEAAQKAKEYLLDYMYDEEGNHYLENIASSNSANEIDGFIHDMKSDAIHYIRTSLENDGIDYIDDAELNQILSAGLKSMDPVSVTLDLSEGSYDRMIIEMITDEMQLGKNPTQIAEELSFDESEVIIICETISNLKKK